MQDSTLALQNRQGCLLPTLNGWPNTQVTFRGNGELGQIQTVATAGGLIKGRVGNPACDPPLRPDGKLAVGTAVGAGMRSSYVFVVQEPEFREICPGTSNVSLLKRCVCPAPPLDVSV